MALNHSPSVVTNGLVFAYDMGNTLKSWKGAPATNLYTDGDYSSGALHPVRSGTWEIVEDPRDSTKKVLKATPSASNQYHGKDITSVVSTVYSLQMQIYVSTDFNGTNVSMYPEQGGSGAARYYDLTKKGTWQSLKYDGISASTTNIRMLAYVLSAFTTGYVLISNTGVEQNAFATPFVAGTRSNTQAIVDLTNTNTVTATSLTYNSDGTISFGTSGTNYFSIPSIDFSAAQTIEIWLKPEENDTNRRNPYNQAYGGYGTWTHEPSGVINYFYGDAGVDNTPYVGHGSSFTVLQNEIACVCTTRDTSTSWWYKNGVQYNSYAHAYGTLTADTNNILIGTGYAGAYYGRIFAVKLYNRALTAKEVEQNFNALRGRYGV